MVKADGSVLLHSDGGSYKPLNWMSPPCTLAVAEPDDESRAAGVTQVWTVQHAKSDDRLDIDLYEVLDDSAHDLGVDPGLVKDGVEAHLQELLAAQIVLLGTGHTLVRREFPTAIGPVDILARTPPARPSRSRSSGAATSTASSSSPATSSCSTATPTSRPCVGCSPPRRSSRRPGCSRRTAASAASCSTTTR